ncbi:FOLR1 [Branchiostoma lanceolatum]|uniref:FOLR1 protein n=1 Tax=Branchiostoma lanceolatum TaxID=7740 RepID=A0A8J9V657_BRALA|nr:FOLR1 [Branchiostoma lanceolatum]
MFSALLLGAAILFSTLTHDLAEAKVVVTSDIPCRPFHEIYPSGRELCEKMWDGSFVYETNRSRAYTMWFFDQDNPNDDVTRNLGLSAPSLCHLRYLHKDTPGPEPDTFAECHPWKENSCCTEDTVSSVQKIKQSYGPEWHWDRCGPLTPACERFFVQEACFYECEPNAGLFRKYPDRHFNASDPSHNRWQMSGMPIWSDFCDAWHRACRNDQFCSHDDGNFFSCAATYTEEQAADGGTVVGIVFGCLVIVALIGVLGFLVFRERTGQPVFKPLEQQVS